MRSADLKWFICSQVELLPTSYPVSVKWHESKSKNIPTSRVPQKTSHHPGHIHYSASSACVVSAQSVSYCFANVTYPDHSCRHQELKNLIFEGKSRNDQLLATSSSQNYLRRIKSEMEQINFF